MINELQQSDVEVIQKELSLFAAWKYHFISYTDQSYFQGQKMAWAAPQQLSLDLICERNGRNITAVTLRKAQQKD